MVVVESAPVEFHPKFAPGTAVGVGVGLLITFTLPVWAGCAADADEEPRVDDPADGDGEDTEPPEDGGGTIAARGPPVARSRYQFTDGSPRHSPSVTRSYFSCRAWSIMYCAKV